jgi:hypothetical protein
MATVETAYTMRQSARIMVASEENEPAEGWNYRLILSALAKDTPADAHAMGRVLVQSFKGHFAGHDDGVTLSAVDLGEIDELVRAVDALADESARQLASNGAIIQKARRECEVYGAPSGMNLVDLGHYCSKLTSSKSGSGEVRQRAEAILGILSSSKLVVDNYAGPDRLRDYGSTGLAVYFPLRTEHTKHDPESRWYLSDNKDSPLSFVREHRWSEFVQRYLRSVP